jgi:hypothetical protein
MNKLINSIQLLSNHKSFTLTIIGANEKLWLLMHFKNLRIIKKTIYYQKTPSVRSRKSTKYLTKKLNKSFDNTLQLLDYLDRKFYTIRYFEMEFEDDFKIIISGNHSVTFYAKSKEERNKLIDKLIEIAGYDKFPIEDLCINNTYFFDANSSLTDSGFGVSPDEFWSEEQKDIWCKEARKEFESDEEPNIERHDFYDSSIPPFPNTDSDSDPDKFKELLNRWL